jgi:hypothetical protein
MRNPVVGEFMRALLQELEDLSVKIQHVRELTSPK